MRLPFRQKLARAEPVIVLNADHPSPSLVEKMARLPIDAVFIDCEQGSPDVESVENMARAARLGGLTSLVRVFDHRDWVIERYMGRGVDGIVVPRLDSAEQAAGVVAAVRYCFPDSHRDKIIVVQIETRRAFETLDEFLGVTGIDVLVLGPVDLAKSLGFAGDFRCPEMQRVLHEAVARIDRRGGVPGILVDRDNAAAWVKAGVRFLYEHADSFLAAGAESFVASIDGIKAGGGANA